MDCTFTYRVISFLYGSSGLAKTILQGRVKGGRRQGRQRKRWEDNITEWTDLEFATSQRAVENRENGGNWLRVRDHLWCPNDPRGLGIDNDDDDDDLHRLSRCHCQLFSAYLDSILVDPQGEKSINLRLPVTCFGNSSLRLRH